MTWFLIAVIILLLFVIRKQNRKLLYLRSRLESKINFLRYTRGPSVLKMIDTHAFLKKLLESLGGPVSKRRIKPTRKWL